MKFEWYNSVTSVCNQQSVDDQSGTISSE